MIRVYGYIPDVLSNQPIHEIQWLDHARLRTGKPLPVKSNNRQFLPPVGDQGSEGSCTAWSAKNAHRFLCRAKGLPDSDLSAQFLYYVTRDTEGDTNDDNGATIADTVAAEGQFGICHEETWPYAQPYFQRPYDAAYQEAKQHVVLARSPVQQTQEALETVLAAGQPIQFGMRVYESFESDATAQTGIVTMPMSGEAFMGGHALYLFDYDSEARVCFGQNSWGQWGQDGQGVFEIPYDMILDGDYCSDLWTVSAVKDG
jgi:C1A family cysteine protease